MRRIRTFDRRHNQDRWLVSYADFITLLFAFFVVMYSAAQLDKRRAGKLATAIQTAFDQAGIAAAEARRCGRTLG
jgi:chemotaxis protein MotB